MNQKIKHYMRGDTIRFDVIPGEGFDEQFDFSLKIYPAAGGGQVQLLRKHQMEALDGGGWRGELPSVVTAAMGAGEYMIELLLKQAAGVNCIAQAPAFELHASESLGELL